MAVVFAAPGAISAFAQLATVGPVRSIRTRDVAVVSSPSGRTLALARDVMALGTVLAHALQAAVWPVRAIRARMLTRQAHVSRATDVIARDVIARLVSKHNFGTLFFACQAVRALRAGRGAVGSGPALVAHAHAGLSIARGIIVAATFF